MKDYKRSKTCSNEHPKLAVELDQRLPTYWKLQPARRLSFQIYVFAVSYHLLYVQYHIITIAWTEVTQKKNKRKQLWIRLLFSSELMAYESYSKQEWKGQPPTCMDKSQAQWANPLACFLEHLILSPDIHRETVKDISINKRLDLSWYASNLACKLWQTYHWQKVSYQKLNLQEPHLSCLLFRR